MLRKGLGGVDKAVAEQEKETKKLFDAHESLVRYHFQDSSEILLRIRAQFRPS